MAPKVFVITYSVYGHVNKLASSVVKGLQKTGGVQVSQFQFPETLNSTILKAIHAAPKPDIPEITVDKLAEADGILFGFPTRYGNAPAQVRAFLDSTGGLFAKASLYGKAGGVFFSTASQHGGQEVTASSFMSNLVHQGMVYVPIGYKSPHLSDLSEIVGGSAWGAGTIAANDGSRQPSEKELAIAEFQGEEFAKVVKKLAGK
ncbi:protoplast secreted protein 2 precursor [Linderina pennispora]|uniref:Protoplast secreted protein 2 n=1 Tax=Linderina pennispora TaxID=61395 RepID=A0A1Y1W6H7_9FUNG|nr:protoplast secreted protein 2 precursor [Linderina pennispora]ORX69157.1 protoplast secreted protein 2 precursor [Linderina pennispora]